MTSAGVHVAGVADAKGGAALSLALAHALNNHLTTVLGFAQLALESVRDHPAAADLREVLSAGEAGRRLIEEYVWEVTGRAGRPQDGGEPPRATPVS